MVWVGEKLGGFLPCLSVRRSFEGEKEARSEKRTATGLRGFRFQPLSCHSPRFEVQFPTPLSKLSLKGNSRQLDSVIARSHVRFPCLPPTDFEFNSHPSPEMTNEFHSNGFTNGDKLNFPHTNGATEHQQGINGSDGPGKPNNNVAEERLDELRQLLGKSRGDVLRIAGVGAGAWGSVFVALLQDAYGSFRDKMQVRIWRRPGRSVDRATAEHLFEVINSREDVLRRLIRRCAYLKYVEARLGDRVLYADEILKDGFCLNMIETPLCPLKVVTNLQEAVWDADIVINGLPSTETKEVFEEISRYWKERRTMPIIISLAKGVEAALTPLPRIITPTQIICRATGVPIENILYLGGPNIASEIYNKEYANARICGSDKWRKPLAKFLRQPHFIVWDNNDLVTHEVMGGLKNVYAIGAGMVAALTNESATSKSVYFAHCTSEMIFITHLIAEEPEKLAGPLLADTYVTLLKGRNAWYGQMLAKGELRPDMGDSIKGKGMIQGVSAVGAFYELLSHSSLSFMHPDGNKPIAPVELCPILKTLYSILITRDSSTQAILQALRDETMHDPRERIEIAQSHAFYRPSLLGQSQ